MIIHTTLLLNKQVVCHQLVMARMPGIFEHGTKVADGHIQLQTDMIWTASSPLKS